MIKNVLENIGGIGIYGIISLCLFFAFFTGMLIWAFRLRKPYLKTMEELPLDNTEPISKGDDKTLLHMQQSFADPENTNS